MARLTPFTLQAVVVEEQVVFTLEGLCRASGASRAQVLAMVDEGVLQPAGLDPNDWQFRGLALRRTRTALRLVHDLDLGWPAAALVLDLLAEIDQLRTRALSNRQAPAQRLQPDSMPAERAGNHSEGHEP